MGNPALRGTHCYHVSNQDVDNCSKSHAKKLKKKKKKKNKRETTVVYSSTNPVLQSAQ